MALSKKEKVGVVGVGIGVVATVVVVARAKAAPLPSLATLLGIVSDADTGKPISGIEVSLNSWVKTTGANGRYEFANIEPGTYGLVFTDPQGMYERLEI